MNIYPESIHDNPPTEFDASIDEACEEIREATKGWGTDEDRLIAALASKMPNTRYEINLRYKEIYDKELKDLMKRELSGDMGMAMQFLSLPPDEADAYMIRKAVSGLGTRERLIYPILCGRTNAEMSILKEAYYREYEEDLAVRMNDELGGDFERFIFHCLQGMEEEFDEEYHSPEKVEEDTALFFEAGEGKFFGTDEKGMFELICKSPPQHLINVNEKYMELHGNSLSEALESEMGGDVERACLYAVGMKIEPYKTVAAQIKRACKGFGTDEISLTMTLVRYMGMLKEVNEAHLEMYEKTIADRVADETSGDYEKVLLQVIETGTAE